MIGKKLVDLFIRLWKTENTEEELTKIEPDVIVPICYGMCTNGLARGTIKALKETVIFWNKFERKPFIAFGSASIYFENSERVEERLKIEFLHANGVSDLNIFSCGSLRNSVEEVKIICEDIFYHLPYKTKQKNERGITILIVCGELHSCSVRFIWEKFVKKYFSPATIFIKTFHHSYEWQESHFNVFQRSVLPYIFVGIVRQTLLRVFGLRITSLLRQPTSVKNSKNI